MEYGFDANSNYISIRCNVIQNGAVVHAKMRDPHEKRRVVYLIDGNLGAVGSSLSTFNAAKGTNYIMKVSYEKLGTAPNHPRGTISY